MSYSNRRWPREFPRHFNCRCAIPAAEEMEVLDAEHQAEIACWRMFGLVVEQYHDETIVHAPYSAAGGAIVGLSGPGAPAWL